MDRLDRPPTWRSAITRAAIAAVIVAILAVAALGNTPVQAAVLAAIMLLVYVPLGYAFDTFIYRLRQRRKRGQATAAASREEASDGRTDRRRRERAR
jgi:hypothetical protein